MTNMTNKIPLLLIPFFLGAGPILVDTEGTGQGIGWKDDVVRYNPETGGGVGRLSNGEAVSLLEELFEEWRGLTWNGVPVADFSVVAGAGLGSVDADNFNDHFTYCPPDESCPGEDPPFILGSSRSGQSPIIFDSDGEITDLVQGVGAKDSILGFAGPRVIEEVGGIQVITEGQAVLNGLFIDCPIGASEDDPCQTPEVTLEGFKGVVFHELGHFIGLDHSQVNLASAIKALSGDLSEVEGVPTMFPLLVDGAAQGSPHFDDMVSLAMLYPSSQFLSSFCTLEGTVYRSDGDTELQGVNVVAQNPSDPLEEATSFVSGQLFVGTPGDCEAVAGDFQIGGLTPGIGYTLKIERISQAFTGGSSIEPCDPPQSGFQEVDLSGTFSCASGGETISVGTNATTKIVTTKGSATGTPADPSPSSGGGCSLIPRVSLSSVFIL